MSKQTPTAEEMAGIAVSDHHPNQVGFPEFQVWWCPRGLTIHLHELNTEAVAAKIVQACRAHDGLTKSLRALIAECRILAKKCQSDGYIEERWKWIIMEAEAALAKAEP